MTRGLRFVPIERPTWPSTAINPVYRQESRRRRALPAARACTAPMAGSRSSSLTQLPGSRDRQAALELLFEPGTARKIPPDRMNDEWLADEFETPRDGHARRLELVRPRRGECRSRPRRPARTPTSRIARARQSRWAWNSCCRPRESIPAARPRRSASAAAPSAPSRAPSIRLRSTARSAARPIQ